jgi:DNA-binding NtrC family response regulator
VYCAKYGLPAKTFDEESLAFIRRHRWPGNVRELESWVHRELLMADGLTMRPAGQTSLERGAVPDAAAALESFCDAKAKAVRCFERAYVISAMRQAEGNVTRAARLAGKERRAFGKLLKKHGIDRQLLGG